MAADSCLSVAQHSPLTVHTLDNESSCGITARIDQPDGKNTYIVSKKDGDLNTNQMQAPNLNLAAPERVESPPIVNLVVPLRVEPPPVLNLASPVRVEPTPVLNLTAPVSVEPLSSMNLVVPLRVEPP